MRASGLKIKSPVCHDCVCLPIGDIFVLFASETVTGIEFEKPHVRHGRAPQHIISEIKAYFEGRAREFTFDIAFSTGTELQQKVWLMLKEIPYGQTRTYKWLAEKLGSPHASRAVGQALSKNPIPIVLPCHRVIESDGSIGGYSAGQDIKRRLLSLEYYHLREDSGKSSD